jgi:hypothetical protein
MKELVAVLLRQARRNNPSRPEVWLADLQATKWTSVSAQNGQIIGTSVNGKSVSLQALPYTSIADLMIATELALQVFEAGGDMPTSSTRAVFR